MTTRTEGPITIARTAKVKMGKTAKILACAVLVALPFGIARIFSIDDEVSADLSALQRTVRISVPVNSIKWEIVTTPDSSGLFSVGPTDYISLVAEAVPADPNWFSAYTGSEVELWIGPDSARKWLSPDFRSFLAAKDPIIHQKAGCKSYMTTVTTSGRSVNGFVCERGGKLLIHLKLLGPN